ncbi:MAG: hypothetical protein KGL39_10875 [Patescibacteria group bacterium]|nr:hypothetical protein [Patescibacteria group bacterium]
MSVCKDELRDFLRDVHGNDPRKKRSNRLGFVHVFDESLDEFIPIVLVSALTEDSYSVR